MKTLSSRFQQKRRYLVGILVLVLIISVGLNLYDHFITLPQMQAIMNDMRVRAFNSWLDEMTACAYILESAETLEDFWHARDHLYYAEGSVATLLTGIDTGYYSEQYTKHLYYWINRATDSLEYAVQRIRALVYKNLSALDDEFISSRIKNITQAIHDIGLSLLTSGISERWTNIGVDPIQQFRDKGKLTDMMNYCKQIAENSEEITHYIGY